MRFLVTVGGGVIAGFLCDTMSKSIEYYYLHKSGRSESLGQSWAASIILIVLLIAGLVFLYKNFGRASFRWREHYFPSLGETIATAVNLPLLLLNLWSATSSANRYGQDQRVPYTALFGFHFLTLMLTIGITAMIITLVRDLLLVRRVGWRQLEQMEAARVKEEGVF